MTALNEDRRANIDFKLFLEIRENKDRSTKKCGSIFSSLCDIAD